MTIHHDKMCYGKLQRLQDNMKEDELLDLVAMLNNEEEESSQQQNEENSTID